MVTNISSTLVSLGVRATTLNISLSHPLRGCYGHPSYADNVEQAAQARPQIAAFMGWT